MFFAQAMSSCYVVFKGKKPGLYSTWAECSEQVLGVSNAVFVKYDDENKAIKDFNAYMGVSTPVQSLQDIPGPSTHVHRRTAGTDVPWKNLVILALVMVICALWLRLSMERQCSMH